MCEESEQRQLHRSRAKVSFQRDGTRGAKPSTSAVLSVFLPREVLSHARPRDKTGTTLLPNKIKGRPFSIRNTLLGEREERSPRLGKADALSCSNTLAAEQSERGVEAGRAGILRNGLTRSLSPRERAGVRGKDTHPLPPCSTWSTMTGRNRGSRLIGSLDDFGIAQQVRNGAPAFWSAASSAAFGRVRALEKRQRTGALQNLAAEDAVSRCWLQPTATIIASLREHRIGNRN